MKLAYELVGLGLQNLSWCTGSIRFVPCRTWGSAKDRSGKKRKIKRIGVSKIMYFPSFRQIHARDGDQTASPKIATCFSDCVKTTPLYI